jgi:ribonuclease Z
LPFEVTILGSNSAIPAYGRNHTAQFIKVKNKRFLIDCGEATQHQIRKFGLKPQQLDAIFISHLHGDHYLGLVGLLSTLHLQGRKKDLTLYGPRGLDDIITLQLKYSDTVFNYKLIFKRVDASKNQVIYEDDKVKVYSIPLKHRIPCSGFKIEEQPQHRRINKLNLPADLSIESIAKLRSGEDIVDDSGQLLFRNKDLTLPAKQARTYAFCSDTRYDPDLPGMIKEVDLLYHEATFLFEKELTAANTYHSTAGQAAQIAKAAGVKRLILGHFSARYKDIRPFEQEARKIFAESYLAIEGKTLVIEN